MNKWAFELLVSQYFAQIPKLFKSLFSPNSLFINEITTSQECKPDSKKQKVNSELLAQLFHFEVLSRIYQ